MLHMLCTEPGIMMQGWNVVSYSAAHVHMPLMGRTVSQQEVAVGSCSYDQEHSSRRPYDADSFDCRIGQRGCTALAVGSHQARGTRVTAVVLS